MKDPILQSVKQSIKALRAAISTHPSEKASKALELSLRLEDELSSGNPCIEVINDIDEQIKRLG